MDFKIPCKGYADRKIFKHATISVNPGVTVLIGCNGSGKTTLLSIIEEKLNDQDIPVFQYDNLQDGGKSAIGASAYAENYELMSALFNASEGESIALNLMNQTEKITHLVSTGRKKRSRFAEIFRPDHDELEITSNQRWILLDAIDSGLSIDQVRDLKQYVLQPLQTIEKYEMYILICANEYEMCVDLPCFNVVEGKYVEINSYDDYRKQVLATRAYKDKEIAKWSAKVAKNDESEV